MKAAAFLMAFSLFANKATANATAPTEPPIARSVGELLERIAAQHDVAFIYETAIGARMAFAAPPEEAGDSLESAVAAIGLRLQQVSAHTYAVLERKPSAASDDYSQLLTAENERTGLDTVLVLGSRAAQQSYGSPYFFVLNQEMLEQSLEISAAEAIYELPQSLASVSSGNTQLTGASVGMNLIDLRGFGASRSQMLINGQRRTPMPAGYDLLFGYDMNSIALPLLERIEISNGFGGARFGSEAVAGAVNFVTKRIDNGILTGAQFGASEHGDAAEYSFHAIGGQRFFDGALRLTTGVAHTEEKGLLGRDRFSTANSFGYAIDGVLSAASGAEFLPGFAGSTVSPTATIKGILTVDGQYIASDLASAGAYVASPDGAISPALFTQDRLYNFAAVSHSLIPTTQTIGLVDVEMQFSSALTFYSEAHIGVSTATVLNAASPSGNAIGIDPIFGAAAVTPISESGLQPAAIAALETAYGADIDKLVVSQRFLEVGQRERRAARRSTEMDVGLRYQLRDNLTVSSSYRFAHHVARTRESNLVDYNRLNIAVDPDTCSITPACKAVDPFAAGNITASAAAFLRAEPQQRRIFHTEHDLRIGATYNGEIGESAVEVKGDAAYRRLKLSSSLGDSHEPNSGAFLIVAPFDAQQDIVEFSQSLGLSGIRAEPVPGIFGLSIAARQSAATEYEIAHNIELAATWAGIDGATLFAGAAYGERPPSITELFALGQAQNGAIIDPCALNDSAFEINCQSSGPLGVPADFAQQRLLARLNVFGNPELEPEVTRFLNAGLELSPILLESTLPGELSLCADWKIYDVKDAIILQWESLFDCYASSDFSDPACHANALTGEQSIVRDPATSALTRVDSILRNDGRIEWQGVDIDAGYSWRPTGNGPIQNIRFYGNHSFVYKLKKESDFEKDGAFLRSRGFPAHRTSLSLGATLASADVVISMNRRGKVFLNQSGRKRAEIPAFMTFDVATKINVGDRADIRVGIENIFEAEPTIVEATQGFNTLPEYYDLIGRRFSIGIRAAL